jgi:hypothetical protein
LGNLLLDCLSWLSYRYYQVHQGTQEKRRRESIYDFYLYANTASHLIFVVISRATRCWAPGRLKPQYIQNNNQLRVSMRYQKCVSHGTDWHPPGWCISYTGSGVAVLRKGGGGGLPPANFLRATASTTPQIPAARRRKRRPDRT